MKLALVAVEKTAFHFDRLFSYLVPERLEAAAARGKRVIVPFGRGNRLAQGMIFSVAPLERPDARMKELAELLDEEPVLDEEAFAIVEFLVDHTFCSYYDAVRTLLPIGLSVRAQTAYLPADFTPEQLLCCTEEEQALLRALAKAKAGEQELLFAGGQGAARRKLAETLAERGLLTREHSLSRRVGDKTMRMVRLAPGVDPDDSRYTPKQRETLSVLAQFGSASEKELCYHAGVTGAVLKTLANKGAIVFFQREVYRLPKGTDDAPHQPEFTLSPEQQAAYEGIAALCRSGSPQAALLFGVTGSGKTQIFIRLIQDTLAAGRQALLLVPEISLTPQMLEKFRGYFGRDVAVLHSGLSLGERLDEYKRIKNGDARIVIGTRSGVFAPVNRLGLIIMDEEGEHSYQSELTPRYHARDIAKLRCAQHGATLLLASATPSVESYYYAKNGRYHLFTLSERYGAAVLPDVFLVDMKTEEQNYNFGPLSDLLCERMLETFERGEQSIVLINRRGHSTFALCMDCGEAVSCPNCSISLTYHQANQYLMCHYCGYTQRLHTPCGHCGSHHIKLMGTGTQKVEELIQKQIPDARILRMDADTVDSRYAYEEQFRRFADGAYDIMVGTQMVAKGLNFPNVTLVGVLGADQYLYSNDYRCGEKTFSLITQVVGRSGRAEKHGAAYIQTVAPENTIIQNAARQDYEAFFAEELAIRKIGLQPPFCDLAVIGFASLEEGRAKHAAQRYYELLRQAVLAQNGALPVVLLGVTQPAVYRIGGKYRYRIIVKCKNTRRFRDLLRQVTAQASQDGLFSKVNVYIDCNGEID